MAVGPGIPEKRSIDNDEIPPTDYNGKVYYSNKEKANIFNVFFIKQSTLEHEDDTPPDLPQLDCQLDDITLSVSEVSNIIQNLDKSKATGPDQVHNRLLLSPLLSLLNLLLHYSTDLSVKASSSLFGNFLTLPPCTKRGPRSFVTTIAPFLY